MTQFRPEQTNFGDGWTPTTDTWEFASVDDPTGVITVPTDATTKYSVGMRITFVNATNTIYGIITAVTATTITFLHEIDPTDSEALHLMADSAITAPEYSTQKAPFGFPPQEPKWTVEASFTTGESNSPDQNTWYNLETVLIAIPIGCWDVSYMASFEFQKNATTTVTGYSTLSTANNSESDADFTWRFYMYDDVASTNLMCAGTTYREKNLTLTTKDIYYLNSRMTDASPTAIRLRSNLSPTILRAVCAYL